MLQGQQFLPVGKSQQISAIGRSSEPTHAGYSQGSRYHDRSKKNEERRNERTKKKIEHEHISRGNREQGIATKQMNKPVPANSCEATSDPASFAKTLISKLNSVLKKQEKDEESSKQLDNKLKKVCSFRIKNT